MTLNPIRFSQDVNQQFLNYQLTAFALSDEDLALQARAILAGQGNSPLIKGPYASISRAYQEGKSLRELADLGLVHPAVAGIAEYPVLFAHQQDTLESVKKGHSVLITSGTGSGKTEAFLYPILDHCFKLRDSNSPPGIVAILVYPMNALAIDQLHRLRSLLAGTGITFGMYIGNTPKSMDDANAKRMKKGEGREKIPEYINRYESQGATIIPFEERHTEAEINEEPPRILLTNVNQLELLVTRAGDQGIFRDAPLKFIVFDEAHTYSGASGAEVSTLIRRLKAFCGKKSADVTCIGTSATITDPVDKEKAGVKFASRFFGVSPDRVDVVREKYTEEKWSKRLINPGQIEDDPEEILSTTLQALKDDAGEKVAEIVQRLTGQTLEPGLPWKESLYEALKMNLLVKTTFDVLDEPMHLTAAVAEIWARIGRRHDVKRNDVVELMTYLVLGAAAEKNGVPLLRPKMHLFGRGLGGTAAVFTRSSGKARVELFFSHQRALAEHKEILPTGVFPIMVCTNCGQHYFVAWVDGKVGVNGLEMGNQEGNAVCWPITDEENGSRIVFTNRFVIEMDDDENSTERLEQKRQEAYICQYCGTIHKDSAMSCSNPGCQRNGELIPIYILKNAENGRINICPACRKRGSGFGVYREPFKPLFAVTVADVFILSQSMLNADTLDKQKLIVFADNRQDAAFQAAWMADHARRYRLRQLMYALICEGEQPVSISDLQDRLFRYMQKDRDLARTLVPEVYAGEVEEAFGRKTEKELKKFLRISIIRELGTTYTQRDSLETWGVARIKYYGLEPDNPGIQSLSAKYGISPDGLILCLEALLDAYRRTRYFYDEVEPIYSHWWAFGDHEVLRGYVPYMDYPPKGLKLQREEDDNTMYATGFTSSRGVTVAYDFVRKCGIRQEQLRECLGDLWELLTRGLKVLSPVTLRNNRGDDLGRATGLYQVDSKKVGIVTQHDRYVCNICHRVHTRDTPEHACTKIHCNGKLRHEEPPADDYNIGMLNRKFNMVVSREHTAQVPAKTREKYEDSFKNPDGTINCLVATPTLELGVDIGALSIILMRNMPPLPSNYWQRAGRAGRRHQMAVIYTYCRNSVHDAYFFEDPRRILSGRIFPPRFNMRNNVMIKKHVHAIILSTLIRISQEETPGAEGLRSILRNVFPSFVNGYLLDDDNKYRLGPYDVSILREVIDRYRPIIEQEVLQVFSDNWPDEARHEVDPEILKGHIDNMAIDLQEQVDLLYRRLAWTMKTRDKILEDEKHGLLDEFKERLLRRCRDYLKKLMKVDLSNYTLSVLASNGFLPGYGSYDGSIVAYAGAAYMNTWQKSSFELTRSPTIAVREYVPGNLIYANGGKYRVALLHLPLRDGGATPDKYVFDLYSEKIDEEGVQTAGYSDGETVNIEGLPVCDSDLSFLSHVSDEETNRYKLPVYVVGYLQPENRGGNAYTSGGNEFQHILGQHVRLVNVGPHDQVDNNEYGYPICTVCGATRSPIVSPAEITKFETIHEKTCGRKPGNYALTSDAIVDGILFKKLTAKADAVNLAEALRIGANQVLEMNLEDIQFLVLPQGGGEYDVFLYDQMVGGSGLLNQMIERWQEIIKAAKDALKGCQNACETSCYSCMKTFRNIQHHEDLNRHRALQLLTMYDHPPKSSHELPMKGRETKPTGVSTNTAEARLRQILLDKGFPPFDAQEEILIPHKKYKRTRPDLLRIDPSTGKKVAIYLDGLSREYHGDPERQKIDMIIRAILRDHGYYVEEMSATSLDDPEMLRLHLRNIARELKMGIDNL